MINKCLMIDNYSDGWTTDDLKYQWKTVDPVQITKDLHLPRSSFHADGFKIVCSHVYRYTSHDVA